LCFNVISKSILVITLPKRFYALGRTYDKNGNQGEFWDEESVEEYNRWVQELAEAYGNEVYQTSETSAETINANQTINEDIADNLGVHISYLSYLEYLKQLEVEGKQEKVLPGLKSYSPQKLFYMKYSNVSLFHYLFIFILELTRNVFSEKMF